MKMISKTGEKTVIFQGNNKGKNDKFWESYKK